MAYHRASYLLVSAEEHGSHHFDDIHHERQRWRCHVFPAKVEEADCDGSKHQQASVGEGSYRSGGFERAERTVFGHQILLGVVRESTGHESVAAVRMFSRECQVEDGGDVEPVLCSPS
jgi:hypothetical protein